MLAELSAIPRLMATYIELEREGSLKKQAQTTFLNQNMRDLNDSAMTTAERIQNIISFSGHWLVEIPVALAFRFAKDV